ncbi:MAG: hypothetical protein ACI90V_012086 [Bacillariaceae sp.]|jgi:hypothetical protein
MVVASFLVEYLRVNWKKGCAWFHYTLVDADSAINAMMWQNAGRSGIDQWNFVSSPTTASQDSTGAYTQRWVPELADLPTSGLIHRPWEGNIDVLLQAGVVLGDTYPHRIVIDLKTERQLSVDSTLSMRRKSQEYNTSRGYDLIRLPNGSKTIVFTKKNIASMKMVDFSKMLQQVCVERKLLVERRSRSLKLKQKLNLVYILTSF